MLFGAGLLLSGMTNPSNVYAISRRDRTLAAVSGIHRAAAVAVALPAYQLAHRRERSLLGIAFEWPDRIRIDRSLVLGSAIFGVGWGLSGICPGPGLVLLTRPGLHAVSFFAGLVLGSLAATLRPPHQRR